VTGEPIQRVLVQISGQRQRSVLTGADGKFQFASVPAGTINVSLQKPGYFTAQSIRSPRMQAAWINVGPDQPPAVLKLIPEAVISGHVMGDGGEPAEQLPVKIFGDHVENGKRTSNALREVRTDDQGEFRFAELPPGRYCIFAGPSSWPASFVPWPQTGVRGGGRRAALGRMPQAARGYPGVFYPAAAEMTSAGQIEVRAGQHVELNLNVASQFFHYIEGTVSGYASEGQGLMLQATNAAGQEIPAGMRFDPATGRFRTLWLPAGNYRLTATMQEPNGPRYFATQEVNLTGDMSDVRLNLASGTTIAVRFRVEKTRPDSSEGTNMTERRMGRHGMVELSGYVPGQVRLTQGQAGGGQLQVVSQLSETDSTPELANVSPGVYGVEIYPNGMFYVESARSGSMDLLEQELTVEAGSSVPPIEITLRDDAAMLSGRIRFSGDAESATVIAIRENGPRQVHNIEVSRPAPGFAGAEGASFNLGQLAPGRYKVLAVNRADFEYRDPQLVAKYADKAREISLEANEQGTIDLEMVHVEE
jgi:hypothetical protein